MKITIEEQINFLKDYSYIYFESLGDYAYIVYDFLFNRLDIRESEDAIKSTDKIVSCINSCNVFEAIADNNFSDIENIGLEEVEISPDLYTGSFSGFINGKAVYMEYKNIEEFNNLLKLINERKE